MQDEPATDRINLVYQSMTGDRSEEVELPFKVLVLSDLTRDDRSAYFGDEPVVRLTEANIGILFQQLQPKLDLNVEDCLSEQGGELTVQLSFQSIEDFTPARVMRSVPALASLLAFNDSLARLMADSEPLQTGDDIELIKSVLKTESMTLAKLKKNAQNYGWLISSIEARICRQIDAIIHQDDFSRLEAAWRSLQFLIERTDFGENCELAFINIGKQGLLDNFEDAPEVFQSQLYQHVYADEFGQFGGRPYGASSVITNPVPGHRILR